MTMFNKSPGPTAARAGRSVFAEDIGPGECLGFGNSAP